MELIEHSQQTLYEKCKYTVKAWEQRFIKQQGRMPSKLDIRESDKEVRNAYRKYFELKTAALEQSFLGVDGFNSDEEICEKPRCIEEKPPILIEKVEIPDRTWGFHLNKKLKEPTKPDNEIKLNPTSSITKKLFTGSKFVKRNPRKSLSQNASKSDSNINSSLSQSSFKENTNTSAELDVSPFLSQPVNFHTYKAEENIWNTLKRNSDPLFDLNNTKISTVANKNLHIQSTNIVKSVLENAYQPRKSVNVDWLNRVEQNTLTDSIMDDSATFNSDDDIIDCSDEETSNVVHIAKKMKIDNNLIPAENKLNSTKLNNDKILQDETRNMDCDINVVSVPNTPSVTINEILTSEVKVITSQIKPSAIRNNLKRSKTEVKKRNLNENFVKIDIQKKVFCRGKKSRTFSKYKKMQWLKKKKEMLHFVDDRDENSRKPKIKIDQLLPIEAEEEDVDIHLTLEQASDGKGSLDCIVPDNNEGKSQNIIINETEYLLEHDVNIQDDLVRDADVVNQAKVTRTELIASQSSNDVDSVKPRRGRSEIVNLDAPNDELVTKMKRGRPKKIKPASDKATKTSKTINTKILPAAKSLKKTKFITDTKETVIKPRTRKTRKPAIVETDLNDDSELGNSDSYKCMSEEESDGRSNKKKAPNRRSKKKIDPPNRETEFRIDHDFGDNFTDDLLLETLRLEDSIGKQPMEPLFPLAENGELIETPEEVMAALRMFGHSSFRPGQERSIMRILSGQSTLVTLSTGSGKSLCYQLPAFLFSRLRKCITLVISPLVSLMEDQIKCVPVFLNAVCLHTNQTKAQREKIIQSLTAGDVKVLLVSPESVVSSNNSLGFGSVLSRLPPIAFACLDEAHCLSQWSHNFRPSYLVICDILRDVLGVKTILGLTATATTNTTNSLIGQLGIPDGANGVISDVPVPKNLMLTVSQDQNRDYALVQLLKTERFEAYRSLIIYCKRRDECDRVAGILRASFTNENLAPSNVKKRKRKTMVAESYHAGMPASQRRSIQKAFMTGELRIVVATIAFGMGINKADIRSVIHYNMPASFENYVQEIGRAGRDGLEAHCHVFIDRQNADRNEHSRHIYGNSIDRHTIRKFLRRVFVTCTCKTDACLKHEVLFGVDETVQMLDVPKENISTLLCYLELHKENYIKMLRSAFTKCKIASYGGPVQFKKAAVNCVPLEMALKMFDGDGRENVNIFEFPIVDVAHAVNYDTGRMKQALKNLEWISVNNQPKRSLLTVQFHDLGFHLLAPGNLTDEQLDEALDNLHTRVLDQENTTYAQLVHVHDKFKEVAAATFEQSLADPEDRSEKLKVNIRFYFESDVPLKRVEPPELTEDEENKLLGDIRNLVCTYRDSSFTGRAIARIFHGIASPNFPAFIWGRCKFWRSHLNIHFNSICKVATVELLRLRE